MDEQSTQEAKMISHEIVKKEFPDEEEYFDFLFDLTIQEIEELEPGKESEFLREIRAVHPELALGYTPVVIIFVVQILRDFTHYTFTESAFQDKIAGAVMDKDEQKKLFVIFNYLKEYFQKKKNQKT